MPLLPRGCLNVEQRGHVLTYRLAIAWALVYVLLTPAATTALFLQPFIIIWTVLQILAGAAAVWGVRTGDNLVLERGALRVLRYASLAYPVSTAVVIVFELVATGHSERWHVLLLGLFPFVSLRGHQRFLDLKAREASAAPLPAEERA